VWGSIGALWIGSDWWRAPGGSEMGRRPHGGAACQDGGEATRWRCVKARSGAPPEPGDNDEGIGAEPPPWRVHPQPQAARLDRREKGGAYFLRHQPVLARLANWEAITSVSYSSVFFYSHAVLIMFMLFSLH